MTHLNRVFQALKRAFQRRKESRERSKRALGWARFFAPFMEVLEDRTLLSASPALPDGLFAPRTGVVGDVTGTALVNAASPAEAAPFSYLGYPAQLTADNQLTVFAIGDIELSSFQPDFLHAHGIRSLVVQGSDATNDTLHIDLSHGDIPLDLTFHGGAGGFDTLVVSGAKSGSYTPGKVFGDGVIQAGSTHITFTGLEPVIVDGTGDADGTYTFTTPSTGAGNDVLTIDSPAAGKNRISGTSGGVAFESVTFSNFRTFVIDTGTNDQTGSDQDQITLASPLVATGLQALTIQTGAGADTFTISTGALPAAASTASISFDGGAGSNTMLFTTPSGADSISIDTDPLVPQANRISGTSGGGTFESITFKNLANLTIDTGANDQTGADADSIEIKSALVVTGLSTLTIKTGAGADTLKLITDELRADDSSASISFDGEGGSDKIIGPDFKASWEIQGHNEGLFGSILAFSNVENLEGGIDRDEFFLSDGASLDGTITGGGDENALDYSEYQTSITVNIGAATATGTAGATGISEVVGGAGTSDTLVGPSAVNLWSITGINTGEIRDILVFQDVENLTGSTTFSDTFVITSDGSISGTLAGGSGGSNSLLVQQADDGAYTVVNSQSTAPGSVTVNGKTVSYSGLDPLLGGTTAARIINGSGFDDDFVLEEAPSGNLRIRNLGADIFDVATSAIVSIFEFAPPSVSLIVKLGLGNDRLQLGDLGAAFTASLEIQGEEGNDLLEGPDAATTWNLSGLNRGTVAGATFSSVENLLGGSNNDSFVFADGAKVDGLIDGGAGQDSLDYSAYSTAVTIKVGAGNDRIESMIGSGHGDTLVGPASQVGFASLNTWTINGNNAGHLISTIRASTALDQAGVGGSSRTITVPYFHGLSDGQSVVYRSTLGAFDTSGLINGQQYFVLVVDGFSFRLTTVAPAVVDILDPDWSTGTSSLARVSGSSLNLDGTTTFDAFDDTITFQVDHGLADGDTVVYHSDLGAVDSSGLTNGTTYFVTVVDTRTVKLLTATPAVANVLAGATWAQGTSSLVTEGTVHDLSFTSFENLEGQGGDDRFAFLTGFSLSGSIDGGFGSNTLDYLAYATAITVDLGNGTAQGTAGFSRVQKVIGGTATSDTLIGPTVDALWTITAADSGTVNATTFTGFENLTGAADNEDGFLLKPGGSVSGTISGGSGGNDTIGVEGPTGSATRTLITNAAAGTVTAGQLFTGSVAFAFTGIESPLSIDLSVAGIATIRGSALNDQVSVSQAGTNITLTNVNPNHVYWDYATQAPSTTARSITRDVSGRDLMIRFGAGDQVSFGSINTQGRNIAFDQDFDGNLSGNFTTGGGNFTITGVSTIKIGAGVTIDTTAAVPANSGTISITTTSDPGSNRTEFSSSITVESGAQLIAAVAGVGGDIILSATNNQFNTSLDDLFGRLITTAATITINNATLRGRDVKLSAAADNRAFTDALGTHTQANPDTSLAVVEAMQSFRPFLGFSNVQATAGVYIQPGTIIDAGRDVEIRAKSFSKSNLFIVGPIFAIGTAKSESNAAVSVQSNVSITANRNVVLESETKNTIDVRTFASAQFAPFGGRVNRKLGPVVISYVSTEAISDATTNVDAGAVVRAENGTVDVLATNRNDRTSSVSATANKGTIAVGVTQAFATANSTATVNGDVSAPHGTITIRAVTENIRNDTAATAGVGEQAYSPTLAFIPNYLSGLAKKSVAEFKTFVGWKSKSAPPVDIVEKFKKFGGSFAVSQSDMSSNATAGIGATGVVAGSAVEVSATNTDHPHIEATSYTVDARSPQTKEKVKKQLAGSLALALGEYTAHSTAYIAGGAQVDAVGEIKVSAQTLLPFESAWERFLAHPKPTDIISTLVNPNFGLAGFTTSWARSLADSEKVGIAGSVNELTLNSTSTARIAAGALINQKSPTSAGNVNVMAETDVEAVNLAGNFRVTLDRSQLFGAGGGKAGVGAAVGILTSVVDATATIESGARVAAQNLLVDANSHIKNVSIGVSGGKSEGFAVNGAFNVVNLDNTTLAQIGTGAIVRTTGTVDVNAHDEDLFNLNLVGAVAVGKTVGVGLSAGINNIQRNTQALIGIQEVRLDEGLKSPPNAGVHGSDNTIDLGYAHGFRTGDKVVYSVGGDTAIFGEIGGLRDGDSYYVRVINPTTIQLARSSAEATRAEVFGSGKVTDTDNVIDLGYTHGFKDGDAVVYDNGGGTDIGGLVNGTTYYVIVVDATKIKLAESQALTVFDLNLTTNPGSGAAHSLRKATTLFGPGNVIDNSNANVINLGYAHGFKDGDAVVYDNGGGTDIGGLVDGKTYYVIVVDATKIKLAATPSGVEVGTVFDLNLIAKPGSGTAHSLRLAVSAIGVTGENHNFGRAFDPATLIVDTFESIDLGYEHGFKTGQAVIYLAGGGTAIGGLESGMLYFAVTDANHPTRIQLAATLIDALLPTPKVIDITVPTTGGTLQGFAVPFVPQYVEFVAEVDLGVDQTGLLIEGIDAGLKEAGVSTGGDSDLSIPEPDPTVNFSADPVVNAATGVIDLGYKHNFKTGDALIYNNGGSSADKDVGGLISGQVYYVIELGDSYDTHADETGGIGNPELDLKDTGLKLSATRGGAAIDLNPTLSFGIFHTLRRTFTADSTSIIATPKSAADSINLGYAHGFTTGQRVFYNNGGAGGVGAGKVAIGSASTGSTGSATEQATVTLSSVGGNNDLVFTAIANGTVDNNVTIEFVDDSTITGNQAFASFSNKTLTIRINEGVTTAAAVVAAVGTSNNPIAANHFTAAVDSAETSGSIGGLASNNEYYVIVIDSTTIRLADTRADALKDKYIDLSADEVTGDAHSIGVPFRAAPVVDNATDTITFAKAHPFSDGQEVIYHNGGGASIGGLIEGHRYFVDIVNARTIRLTETAPEALASPAATWVNLDASVATGSGHYLSGAPGTGSLSAQGAVTVKSTSGGGSYTITIAAATTETKDKKKSGATESKSSSGQSKAKYGVSVSGSVSVNILSDVTKAYVSDAVVLNAGGLEVAATENTLVFAVSGSAALSTSKKGGFGLAGAVTVNLIDNGTTAYIHNSTLTDVGSLTIRAEDKAEIRAIAAGFGGATQSNGSGLEGTGVAGSVAVNRIESDTDAYVDGQSVITGATNVLITATEKPTIATVAGAIAFGGKNGVGASIAINFIDTHAYAYVAGSDIAASGNVIVSAETQADIVSVTATIGVGNKGMAIAGSLGVNVVNTGTQAYVTGKKTTGIDAAGSVAVTAHNASDFSLWAGNVAFSFKGDAAIGVAATILVHESNTQAHIDGSARVVGDGFGTAVVVATGAKDADGNRVTAPMSGVAVVATSTQDILTIAVGGAIAAKGKVGFAGSTVVNVLDETTQAYIGGTAAVNPDTSPSNAVADQSVHVVAYDNTSIISVAGAVAYGADKAGIGVGLDVAIIDKLTEARIDAGATAKAQSNVIVRAQSFEDVISVVATLGFSKNWAWAGSASVYVLDTDTRAVIGGDEAISPAATVGAGGNVYVAADDTADFVMVAGTIAIGKEKGVGAAATVLVQDDTVQAYVGKNAVVDALGAGDALPAFTGARDSDGNMLTRPVNGLVVTATSHEDLLTIAGGGAGGKTVGIQGSLVVMVLDQHTKGFIDEGAQINTGLGTHDARQDVYVLASDNTEVLSVAGAIGVGQKAGIGVAADIGVIDKETLSWIGAHTVVNAADNIFVLARSNEDIIGVAATIAVGKSGGVGASVPRFVVDTATKAYIAGQADDDRVAIITAEGNLQISADGHADILLVGGTLGLGKSAGVGASATVLTHNDVVEAYIGQYAHVTAKGLRSGLTVNTGEFDDNGSPLTATAKGLFVTAISTEEMLTIAVAGTYGGTFSLAASASVNRLHETTLAHIDPNADIIAVNEVSDLGPSAHVIAADSTDVFGLGGSLGGSKTAGFGIGVDDGSVTKNTRAYVGAGASIDAEDAILIKANSREEVLSLAAGLALSGSIAVAGSATVYYFDNTTLAYVAGTASDTEQTHVQTDGSIQVSALDNTRALMVGGSIAATGSVAVGAAAAVPEVQKTTESFIGFSVIKREGFADESIGLGGHADVVARAVAGKSLITVHTGEFNLPATLPANSGNDIGLTFDPAKSVDPQTDEIMFLTAHGFTEGQEVQYSNGGGASIGGLVHNGTYYVHVVDPTTITLKDAAGAAGTTVQLSGGATGNDHRLLTAAYDMSQGFSGDIDGDTSSGPGLPAEVTDFITRNRTSTAQTVTMAGLAVTAVNKDDFKTFGLSAGASGSAAVNVGGTVTIVTNTTRAHIDDGALINGGDNSGAGTAQSVLVAAGNDYHHWGIAGGVALSGTFAAVPGISYLSFTGTTEAFIGNATVHAQRDVNVLARNNLDILSIAGAVAGSGTFSLAGAASVQVYDLHTRAYIGNSETASADAGDHAVVDAGGTVQVSASDNTKDFLIAGSLGIGGGAAGVGGSVSILVINKDTRAFIGDYAHVDGRANTGTGAPVSDGTISTSREDIFGTNTTNYGTKTVKGVAVQASSSEDIFSLGVAGGGGLYFGFAGGVTVNVIDSTTYAYIGNQASINKAGGTSGNAQDVSVAAVNNLTILSVAGGLGVGFVGLGGGVEIGSVHNDVAAYTGAGAQVHANRNVELHALGGKDIDSVGLSIGGGALALAASISVWTIGDTFSSEYQVPGEGAKSALPGNPLSFLDKIASGTDPSTDRDDEDTSDQDNGFGSILSGLTGDDRRNSQDSLPDNNVAVAGSRNQAGGRIAASSPGNSAITSRTTNAPIPVTTTVPEGTAAFIGNASVVTAGGSITVHAEENLEFDVLVGNASIGAGAAGAGIGILNLSSNVQAFIDTNAQITAGSDASDNVNVKAVFHEDLSGRSYGGAIGAVGLSGQILVFNDYSAQRAYINDGVQIKQAGGSVNVTATTDRDFDVEAIGGNVGGLAAGASVAYVKIEPRPLQSTTEAVTSAKVGNNVLIGKAANQTVNNLSVTADSDIDARSYTVAVAAGVLAGAGSDAKVVVTPTIAASIGTGADIDVGNDITVTAESTANAEAESLGVAVAGLSIGVSLASALIGGNVWATIGTGAALISAGRHIKVGARQNEDENGNPISGKRARAKGNASGGGLLSGNGTDVDAVASPNVEAAVGSGLTTTGGDVVIQALANNVAVAEAPHNITIGVGLSVGQVFADAVTNGTTKASLGGGTTDVQGDITVEARNISDADTQAMSGGGGLITGGGVEATATAVPVVYSYVGQDAQVTATGDVQINASAVVGTYAEAKGVQAGGFAVGVSKSFATAAPQVKAGLGLPDDTTLGTSTSGNVTVEASTLTIQASTGSLSRTGYAASAKSTGSAGGLIGIFSTQSTAANNSQVRGYVGDGSELTITGKTTVSAQNIMKQMAVSDSSQGGLAALGAANATVSSSTFTQAFLGQNVEMTGGALEVSARGSQDNSAQATASAGGVVSSTGTSATANALDNVTAATGSGVTLPNGDVTIKADSETRQHAIASGVAGGLLGVGLCDATASSDVSVNATLGSNTITSATRSGQLRVEATGIDHNLAESTAGSGGVVAGNASRATTLDLSDVTTTIHSAPDAIRAGAVTFDASHLSDYLATANSLNAAALGASGASATATSNTSALTTLDNNVKITASGEVRITSENKFTRPANGIATVKAAGGGAITGAAASSTTNLTGLSKVLIGDNVEIKHLTTPLLTDGIVIVASSSADVDDDIDLSTGGAITGADVDARLILIVTNLVSIGNNVQLISTGNIDIGTYTHALATTSAYESTWGLAAVGSASATTQIHSIQDVLIGTGSTIEAFGNVNITAGSDPEGVFKTVLSGSSSAQGYVRGLIAIPIAKAVTAIRSDASLSIGASTKVRSGQNSTLETSRGTITAPAFGTARGFQLGFIPVETHDQSSPVSGAATLNMEGTVEAGIYSRLNITIPNSGNVGPGGIYSNTMNVDPGGAPFMAVFHPSFSTPDFASVYFNSADQQKVSSGTSSAPVAAWELFDLFASGGNVTIHSDTITGNGTATATGLPSITITNHSPDYLILHNITIPNLPGGKVLFTGRAKTGIAVVENTPGTGGTITIHNSFDGHVGNASFGPALFLVGDVENLGGLIEVTNDSGSVFTAAGVFGQQVVISAPQGVVALSKPANAPFLGGNPYSEWQNYMIWPGGNPATSTTLDADQAMVWAVNYIFRDTRGATTDSLSTALYHQPGAVAPENRSYVYFGNGVGYEVHLPSKGIMTTTHANGLSPFGDGHYVFGSGVPVFFNNRYYPKVRWVDLTKTSTTYNNASLVGSQNSSITGAQVYITGQTIDINTKITAGTPTDWSLDLPATLTGLLTAYQQDYARGGPRQIAVPLQTTTFGDAQITATYDAAENRIYVNKVVAAATSGFVKIQGGIMSTNQLGNIHVNGGLGDVEINNQTGIPLVVQDVYTGSSSQAAAARVGGKVEIIDTYQATHKLYVNQFGQGIKVYTTSDMNMSLEDLENQASTTISGLSTTYSPLANQRWQWSLYAGLERTVANSTNADVFYPSVTDWRFKFPSGQPNNPWQYVDDLNNRTNTPTGRRAIDPNNSSVFSQTISGGSNGAFGVTLTMGYVLNRPIGYNPFDPIDPDAPLLYSDEGFIQQTPTDNQAFWKYHFPTDGFVRMDMSVKADNPVTIGFGGNAVGRVLINSNAPVILAGQINNPDGDTSIATSSVDGVTSAGSSIVTHNLALAARGGIGTKAQPVQAALTGTGASAGTLTVDAGGQGVFLDLDSGAVINQISAHGFIQIGVDHGRPVFREIYGDVSVQATGSLTRQSGLVPDINVIGQNITLDSANGAIGALDSALVLSAHPVALANGGTKDGIVTLHAQGDISVEQRGGDLLVGSILSESGNVAVNVTAGGIFDASGQTAANVLSEEQIEAVWARLHLTRDEGAETNAELSVAAFENLVERKYGDYWRLLLNGSVVGGIYTLSDSSIALYRPLAAAELGDPNPTDDAVKGYAGSLYDSVVAFFDNNNGPGDLPPLGASWRTLADFVTFNPAFTFTASQAQHDALVANAIWDENELRYAVNSAALTPGTPVGIGTPNVAGGDVTLHASGSIGRLAPDVSITLPDLQAGTLTNEQIGALALATAPGDVKLYGVDAAGKTVVYTFGSQPAGVSLDGLKLAQTAPFFISALGKFKATAGGTVFLQSTIDDVSLDNIDAGGTVSVTTPRSILSSGDSTTQIKTTGDLRLLAGTGDIGATSTPLVIDIGGILTSASAGGNLSLRQATGNLNFDRVVAGGDAALTVSNGGLFQNTSGTAIVADSLDLTASGAVGTSSAFIEIRLDPSGELNAIAPDGAYLGSDAVLNIDQIDVQSGDVTIDVQRSDAGNGEDIVLTATATVNASGNVSLLAGDNITILAGASVTAGQTATLTGDRSTSDLSGTTIKIQGSVHADEIAVNGGSQADTILIDMSAAGNMLVGHATVLGGGSGDSIVIRRLNSRSDSLDVEGGDGLDTLDVDNSSSPTPSTGDLTGTSLTGLGMGVGITYGTVEVLNISLGEGGNTFNVQATAAETITTLNSGNGNDVLTVDSNGALPNGTVDGVVSSLTINGQDGFNVLTLEDQSDATADQVHVTPTQVGAAADDTFFGPGGVLVYSELDQVILNMSQASLPDTIHVTPSRLGTEFFIRGGNPQAPMQRVQLPGDALYLNFTGLAAAERLDVRLNATGLNDPAGPVFNVWTIPGHGAVNYKQIETMNHVQTLAVVQQSGIRVVDAETGLQKFSLPAITAGSRGRVAVGDVNGDAIPDIILASARPGGRKVGVRNLPSQRLGRKRSPFNGAASTVRVYNGATGALLLDLPRLARAAQTWAVTVGDINLDGLADIITCSVLRGKVIVQVFDAYKLLTGQPNPVISQFRLSTRRFTGNLEVGVGDLTGDGVLDITTASGAGRKLVMRIYVTHLSADQAAVTHSMLTSFRATP